MFLTIALLAFAAQPQTPEPEPCPNLIRNTWDPKFSPGQKWTYYSRPQDTGSTLTIGEIDDVPGIGFVVHIVVDAPTKYPKGTPDNLPLTHEISHFAIRRDSLDSSVLQVVDNVRIPDMTTTHPYWRAHCAAQTYSGTVADTLTLLDFQRCAEQEKRHPSPHPHAPCKLQPQTSPPSLPQEPMSTTLPAVSSPAPASPPKN
jgi:hypothetical protein